MIIKHAELQDVREAYLVVQPDQFKSLAEKRSKKWIKHCMDYFSNEAYRQYMENKDKFERNYQLLKGILKQSDFYQEAQQVKSFVDTIVDEEVDLPAYVKHYPILNVPINTLVGEMSKRPNTRFVKDFSDEGQAEELQAKTQMVMNFIVQSAQQKIMAQAAMSGQELNDEEMEAAMAEELEKNLASYNTLAESWANHVVKATDRYFNMKEKSEDGFRDLLAVSREYYHVFEDKSELGLNIENKNPKNVWYMTTPNKKYIHKGNGSHEIGAYAAGTVDIMELSEIIEKFDLTKEEIDYLRKKQDSFGAISTRESNLFNGETGYESVTYDTYDKLIVQERMLAESALGADGSGDEGSIFGLNSNTSTYSLKYTVVQAYWVSKIKVGRVTYLDEFGNEQSVEVSEEYVEGSHPMEVSVEWTYKNKWWKGYKIGSDIYNAEPLRILNYCPIIGVVHENRNTEAKSMVDMMKPLQIIYNVAINQVWKLLEKDKGVVFMSTLRTIPIPKDSDGEDAVDIWEEEIKRRGLIIIDDSPENMKGGQSGFNQFNRVDLSRHNEIQARIALAEWAKKECWELVGINRERTGGVAATQTATGTQTAMSQSYAQTEPLFVQHGYIMNDVYQALVDALQYIESAKPFSTIKYVTNDGEQQFLRVQGAEISLRKLFVFVVDNTEDLQNLQNLRQLAQAMLQNGVSAYEVTKIYATNSMRKIEQIMEKVKAKQEEFAAQQQQIEQEANQMAAQEMQMKMQLEVSENEKDRLHESYENQLDRIAEKERALIMAYGRNDNALQDNNANGLADALEVTRLGNEIAQADEEFRYKWEALQMQRKDADDKKQIELEKLKVARENMQNDKEIAKINAQNRAAKAKAVKKKPKK